MQPFILWQNLRKFVFIGDGVQYIGNSPLYILVLDSIFEAGNNTIEVVVDGRPPDSLAIVFGKSLHSPTNHISFLLFHIAHARCIALPLYLYASSHIPHFQCSIHQIRRTLQALLLGCLTVLTARCPQMTMTGKLLSHSCLHCRFDCSFSFLFWCV